jgi:membrane carboxypeptidase/penicillin-binding protein
MPSSRDRLALLRARLRPDPRVPARVWMRRHWLGMLALVLLVAAVAAGDVWLATCGFERCPTSAEIRGFRPSEGGRILDRRGQTLGRVRAVRRANVPLARVPLHVRQAFVATEDRRFFDHDGVDWRGVLRASAVNVRALGVREGFSTITMQLARNTFAVERQGERSMARKLLELRLSRLIEHTLTKEQILELYLNVIYLGNGVYGVEGASRDLFGRGVDRVTVAQAAMLAALPKGPSSYTPRRHPERALRRRNLVLALMAREGYLTAAQARGAVGERVVVPANEWRPDQRDDSYALDAVRAVVDSVREALGIESNDLTVHTTLDLAAQRAAQRAVQRRADVIDGMTAGAEGVEGAMVALDPRSGDVRALVGGRRYERGNFNRVLRARRQPGSAFKPFVYAAVVDRARRNGITSRIDPNPAIALGAAEVTPLELVSAYAPFANGGFRVTPRLVTRIDGVDGAMLWASEPQKSNVMDARDAFLLTSMLKSVVEEGTATAVRAGGVRDPVAGKTGTTNDGTDVWFVGYTPTLVAGFWFGYDEPRSMGRNASGGRMAAPAWAEFYTAGWKERGQDWVAPAGLVQRRIDAHNGQLAGEWCPVTRDEWFRAGTEPAEHCERHYAPEPEPVWQDLPPQVGEAVEDVAKKGGSKLKRALGKIFRW